MSLFFKYLITFRASQRKKINIFQYGNGKKIHCQLSVLSCRHAKEMVCKFARENDDLFANLFSSVSDPRSISGIMDPKIEKIHFFFYIYTYNIMLQKLYLSFSSSMENYISAGRSTELALYWLYIVSLISGLEHYYSLGTQYDWLLGRGLTLVIWYNNTDPIVNICNVYIL